MSTLTSQEIEENVYAVKSELFTDEERIARAMRLKDRARRRFHNYQRRLKDAALRELCGASAAAARRDMGMS